MVAINRDSSLLPTTVRTKKKKSSRVCSLRSLTACLCGLACINLTGALVLLVLEKFSIISWGPAKDALVTFEKTLEDIDHAVIEEKMGIKILSMELYNQQQAQDETNQKELDTLRKWLADKQHEVENLQTESKNVQNMADNVKQERDDLAISNNALKKSTEELQQKILDLQNERVGWRKEVDRIKVERDDAVKQAEQAKKQASELETKVKELQEKVDEKADDDVVEVPAE